MVKLPRDFYLQNTVEVAKSLLGKVICHRVGEELLCAEITETEAYTGVDDKACHSYGDRRTPRTEVLYGQGGHAYVYLIYGMYDMLNVVTEPRGTPCAVLVRAARPLEGSRDAVARLRRGRAWDQLTPAQRRGLMDGPGKVCRGLGVTRSHNGLDLLGETLFVAEHPYPAPFAIGAGERINIDYAEEAARWPYRFFQQALPTD